MGEKIATFRNFEEIQAWQKARQVVRHIYFVSKRGEFGKDFVLRDQICRAAVSIMANIAEGFERDGTLEFIQFLTIAKASASEVESHLYVALDQGYITQKNFDEIVVLINDTLRTIAGLVHYLRNSGIRGEKYRNSKLETRNKKLETGFALPTAIFLIVVLAALGAFIVSISTSSQSSSALDIQGIRAYQAARAGVEWGIYQVVDPTNALGSNLANCPASPTNFAAGSLTGTLSAFAVTVTCSESAQYTEGSATKIIKVYKLTATATSGTINTPNYTNRQVTVTVSKCKDSSAAAPRYLCS